MTIGCTNSSSVSSGMSNLPDFNAASDLHLFSVGSSLTDFDSLNQSQQQQSQTHQQRGQLNLLKKSGSDVDTLAYDSDDLVRNAVNTTQPWGLNPVDQSTPWKCTESNGLAGLSLTNSPSNDSQPISNTGTRGLMLDSPKPPLLLNFHSRRLSSIGGGGGVSDRDLESNVWSNEPPNGTGIWESHYESLGERTARWQSNNHNTSSPQQLQQHFASPQQQLSQQFINQSNFPNSVIRSRTQQVAPFLTTDNAFFRSPAPVGVSRTTLSSTMFPLNQPSNGPTRPLMGNPAPHLNTNVAGSNNRTNFAGGSLGPIGSWSYNGSNLPSKLCF